MSNLLTVLLSFIALTIGFMAQANDKAFSNRPVDKKKFIAIVRLKTPALLTTAKKVDGKVTVDVETKAAILAEQEKFIAEAKELSDEILILNQYKMVLNAVTLVAPIELEEKFKSLSGFSYVEKETRFARAEAFEKAEITGDEKFAKNSVNFIGADKVHSILKMKGEKIRVGVADTGIDYTHSMLGGSGDSEVYKKMDPSKASELFPNKKVVGGVDFVGTDYDASSGDFAKHIPKPDVNPIDEGGHGSHVAGSIAGLGDGVNSYDGVAPAAELYALKVFGKTGSVGDSVIVAAFEYAADPNGDMDPSDQLDVLNLSLGGGFGKPHILYKEAVKNLVNGGTVVVASAGNSGDESYIVGAPSTAAEALSVAASIDNMAHNINFKASKKLSGDSSFLVEAIEGAISKPIKDSDVTGKFVFIGMADTDFSEEVKAQLKGNVALIDRGAVSFIDKLKRASEAGAIGAVVANNKKGDPIAMGGTGKVEIPAIMVTLANGNKIKEEMKKGDVSITFKTDVKIEKKELVDTLTGFSSRGPRSMDALLKPEISGPGYNIISAQMGGGTKAVKMSGTSMSAPHLAGVMALMKQARPNLTALELKALVLGTAKTMTDKDKNIYPVSRQGAGRVQVFKAAQTKFIAMPSTLSLGEVLVEKSKIMKKKFKVKNFADKEVTLKVSIENKPTLEVSSVESLFLDAGEEKEIELTFKVKAHKGEHFSNEVDTFVKFLNSEDFEVLRVPVMAVIQKVSSLKGEKLLVSSTSSNDSADAVSKLVLKNTGKNSGVVEIFNLLGFDDRKGTSGHENDTRSLRCDLQAAGHRIVTKTVEGKKVDFLQVGVKLYNPVTTWQACEVSLLVDGDSDGVADQELVGLILENLQGMEQFGDYNFASLLLDAKKAKAIRAKFQIDSAQSSARLKPDYKPAVLEKNEMVAYNHSTINIIEVPLAKLKRDSNNFLTVKLAVLNEDQGAIEADDFLFNKWFTIDPSKGGEAYSKLPEALTVKAGKTTEVELIKGEGHKELLLLFPHNKTVKSLSETDEQFQIMKAIYNQ